ncbi:hypothetical protein BCR33DRAFT_719133 [Rhizoclosmatium globosum]|uniref:P-loop containing nucleoside triphosphate hydrolase protein n=1 Tax=Rhizoclosmatium globosum TaxID=329046 RepID=A0A1Y2C204_9FUNG|nr:hypothetical protein BCR33DRAFT_719133 [Rhizoclosmatium globosum]|eukprot:ORY41041.1 hypothetical protein BCR33DRAFT_719133 [Rhizoclosmatium globosum]
MGLGKTIQVIAFLSAVTHKTGIPDEKNTRKLMHRNGRLQQMEPSEIFRALIRELDTWGYFSTGIFHGTMRKETLAKAVVGLLEVTITSFGTARNYQHELDTVPWSCIIVDEVHQLKGISSQSSHFGLTGTAIQNKYKDLWCILDFCNRGSVGKESSFEQSIAVPLKRGQAFDATKREIAEARRVATKFRELVLQKYMLRRTKSLIAHQMPKKEDKIVFCPMSETQTKAYASLLKSDDFQLLIRKDERCDFYTGKCCYSRNSENVPIGHTVLSALVTLQKVSNHIALIMPDQADPPEKQEKDKTLVQFAFPNGPSPDSLKMTWINMRNPDLEKLLEVWKKLNSKVLLFSASVKLLNMLEILMSDKSYYYSRLDGKTPIADRLEIVDKFNNDPRQFVFLISTRAGGVGLNLTSANVVVIFDPNWNPSHDLQAQDRAFRIGQTRDVSVYRLIAAGSLEEVIYGRQVYKQQQAQIGYEASEERRLFSGIQGDKKKKGELFGLENLLTVYSDSEVITKLIIDKLEKAESKFLVQGGEIVATGGVEIVDMVPVVAEEQNIDEMEEDEDTGARKKQKISAIGEEDEEANSIKNAFKDLIEDQKAILAKQERDAVSAILSGHSISYTHVNTDILGSSKAEKLITKDALRAVEAGELTQEPVYGFAPDDDAGNDGDITEEVRAEEYEYNEFAELVVKSSREERENMIDRFRRSLR